jgi:hypothetical protein
MEASSNENTILLVQINLVDYFIHYNLTPTTHHQALNTGVSKTNQDSGFNGFINEYFAMRYFVKRRKSYVV